MDGQISQGFAVQFVILLAQFMHEDGIGHAGQPASGIDPGDPQAPEIPFFGPPVTVGITPGLMYLITGRLKKATFT
jgi:hypothetical protein